MPFRWERVAQRKTKVNGKMPKIHITSCRQRNNFSAVSLTSVLSVLIKAHKKFSPYLYKDIYCHTDILKPYSDAYDYAEEAICFLCRFLGKKLGDLCIGKFGKPLPIRLACYRYLGRMLWKKYNKNTKYEVGSYEDQNLRHNELTIDPYAKQSTEEAYERYHKIIETMKLPDYEYETLLAMMNGMRMIDMKRYFNVDYTTIYRRKLRIQKKYLHAVSALQ